MYRILADHGEVRERRAIRVHRVYRKPELLATAPNEVWSWDITKLRGPATWTGYALYTVLDIFSRYVVGWRIETVESGDFAAELVAESESMRPRFFNPLPHTAWINGAKTVSLPQPSVPPSKMA